MFTSVNDDACEKREKEERREGKRLWCMCVGGVYAWQLLQEMSD